MWAEQLLRGRESLCPVSPGDAAQCEGQPAAERALCALGGAPRPQPRATATRVSEGPDWGTEWGYTPGVPLEDTPGSGRCQPGTPAGPAQRCPARGSAGTAALTPRLPRLGGRTQLRRLGRRRFLVPLLLLLLLLLLPQLQLLLPGELRGL